MPAGLTRQGARRVGKNALARLSAQVWAKLLSVTLVALVARYESTTGVGRYVLVVTLVGIAGAVGDLGLNIFLTREAARETDAQCQRELLGMVLPLKAGLSTIGIIGLLVVAVLAPFPETTRRLIPLGALSLLPEGLMGTLAAAINARQRMEVSAGLTMAVRLVTLVGSLPALYLGYGVAGVLVCTFVASLLGLLSFGTVLRHWRLLPHYRWAPRAWRACLAESYPFALTGIITTVYARLDLILLGLWQGELVAGWYGAAYKLWEAFGLLPASLLDAMFPAMSLLSAHQEGMQRLQGLFHASARVMAVAGFAFAAAGAWGAETLMPLVYGAGGDYYPAVLAFRLMVWAIPAMFLYFLSGHTLYVLGKQRRVTVVMLLIGLLNGALNIVMIPRWSYRGAAGVALCSEWLIFGLLYPSARHALADRQGPTKPAS
jgi:O-antigen/teichoic acid export membrane protein